MNPTPGPELRDIHVPPPPSWWPPAPGWWIVAFIVLALLGVAAVYLYKKIQRRRRRVALMQEFDRAVGAANQDPIALAGSLSTFLRRLALRNSNAPAALSGDAWLRYLDAQSESDEFTRGIGRVLIEAPYRQSSSYDVPALVALTRRYTRKVAADV